MNNGSNWSSLLIAGWAGFIIATALFIGLLLVWRRAARKAVTANHESRAFGSDSIAMEIEQHRNDLRELVGRLDSESRAALEFAAAETHSRQQYDVEIEHLLLGLSRSDSFAGLIGNPDLAAELKSDLEHGISRFRSGHIGNPAMSDALVYLLGQASLIAAGQTDDGVIRSEHLAYCLVNEAELNEVIGRSTKVFSKLVSESGK